MGCCQAPSVAQAGSEDGCCSSSGCSGRSSIAAEQPCKRRRVDGDEAPPDLACAAAEAPPQMSLRELPRREAPSRAPALPRLPPPEPGDERTPPRVCAGASGFTSLALVGDSPGHSPGSEEPALDDARLRPSWAKGGGGVARYRPVCGGAPAQEEMATAPELPKPRARATSAAQQADASGHREGRASGDGEDRIQGAPTPARAIAAVAGDTGIVEWGDSSGEDRRIASARGRGASGGRLPFAEACLPTLGAAGQSPISTMDDGTETPFDGTGSDADESVLAGQREEVGAAVVEPRRLDLAAAGPDPTSAEAEDEAEAEAEAAGARRSGASGAGGASAGAVGAERSSEGHAARVQPRGSGNAQRRSDTAPPSKTRHRSDSAAVDCSAAVGASASASTECGSEAKVVADAQEGASKAVADADSAADTSVGESWPSFLERVGERAATVGETPDKLFESFRTTDDLALSFATFAHLFRLASQAPDSVPAAPWSGSTGGDASAAKRWQFPFEPIRVLLGGNWKAKKLWEKLDARIAKREVSGAPLAEGRLKGKRVVVVGAGPCGLYAAIELRLLGARVTVVERREAFTRINQLHLWPWCGEELKELGARCLEPPPQDFGANPDLLSIAIGDLQALLLKTSLLFGVELFLGTDFVSIGNPGEDGAWSVQLRPAPSSGGLLRISPDPPSVLPDVGLLIGTDGGAVVGRSVGIEAVELGSLRAEDAIGLVCNFAVLTAGVAAKRLRSFALASQFYGPLFGKLLQATGAELENIVFTKSKNSYYMVMTPTRRSLVKSGVLRDAAYKPLLARENVDTKALEALCRRIAGFHFKDSEPSLLEAAREAAAAGGSPSKGGGGGEVAAAAAAAAAASAAEASDEELLAFADRGPQLFDFSKLRRASEGLVFMDAPPGLPGVEPLPVALAGDALLEPFWPEGLGIVRGFLSALDVSSALVRWSAGADEEAVRQHFSAAFSQLKTLGARTRANVMRPDEGSYGLEPVTRYRMLGGEGAAASTT